METTTQNNARPYLVLLLGIASVSLAAIFIKLAQQGGVPSLVISVMRLGIASLLLTPLALRKHLPDIRALNRNDFLLVLLSGVFLAIHFASWVSSLQYTTVLISVVLVTTTPIWVGLLEVFFLKAALTSSILIGMVIALAGGVMIALGGDIGQAGSNPVLGGILALVGAWAVAVYLIIGRKIRATLPLIPYIWLVYGSASLILLVVIALNHLPLTGYSTESYLWLVAMAVFPQLLGHSSFNYVLAYLPATYVSLATQLEPIGSAIAAFIIFHERPGALQLLGSLAILIGVALATLRPQREEVAKQEAELQALE